MIEEIELRAHYDCAGEIEALEVLAAPPLARASVEMLARLDPQYRDPDDPDVLVLAPDVRYRVGKHMDGGRTRLLHRLVRP